jgi:hypothetical protein
MPKFPADAHLKGGRNAAESHRQAAREFYAPLLPLVAELRRQGLSLRAIARELDRRGVRTRQVGWVASVDGPDGPAWSELTPIRWSATHVSRMLERAAGEEGIDVAPAPGGARPDAVTQADKC